MKRFTIIFALCITTLAGHSQYESAFGDSVTSWNVADGYIDGIATDTITTIGDTVINNLNYKKLMWQEAYNTSAKYFYLREDTTEGKIWYLADTSIAEVLVSDLTLEEGDIFQYPSFYGPEQTEVDSVFFEDGVKHVRLYYITFNFIALEFIEGSVSNGGPIWFPMDDTIGALLLCQHKDDVQTYQREEFPYEDMCNVLDVGTDRVNAENSYLLFPNPAKSNFHVKLPSGIDEIGGLFISDVTGKIVQEVENYKSGESINIDALYTGTYLIFGWLEGSLLFKQVFVKQ